MKLTVRLINGESFDRTLQDTPIIVGRSNRCQLVIPHEGVSRQHVQIDVENGDVFITDLGSTNGVMIDGEKIPANEKILYQTFRLLSFGAVESLLIEFETSEASRIMTNPLGKYSKQATTMMQNELTRVEAFAHKKPTQTQAQNLADSQSSHQQKGGSPLGKKKKPKAMGKKEANENFSRIMMNVIVISFLLVVIWYFYDKQQTEEMEKAAAPKIKEQKEKEKQKKSSTQYL